MARIHKTHPQAGLKAAPRPATKRYEATRRLSDKQRNNPLIRAALPRLTELPANRGKFLRRLDNVHSSGRRARAEVFHALSDVAEQLLCRLDLATGALGWLDEATGDFRLNTQRGIAEDSSVSAPRLSRLFARLVEAGYAHTQIEKIQVREAGLELVRTRKLVRFTDLFFHDLGLSLHYERAQRAARKRRDRQIANLAERQAAEAGRRGLEQLQREQRRKRWESTESRRNRSNEDGPAGEAYLHAMHELRLALKLASPGLTADEVNAQAGQLFSDRARRN